MVMIPVRLTPVTIVLVAIDLYEDGLLSPENCIKHIKANIERVDTLLKATPIYIEVADAIVQPEASQPK